MLSSLFFSFVSLSLNETINTNRLNKIKTIRKNKKFKLVRIAKYSDDKINTNEIKKTRYLKTAIIDRE